MRGPAGEKRELFRREKTRYNFCMHFVALGIVMLVVLIVVLNPKRWQRLSDGARRLKKGVETGLDEEGEPDEHGPER